MKWKYSLVVFVLKNLFFRPRINILIDKALNIIYCLKLPRLNSYIIVQQHLIFIIYFILNLNPCLIYS